MAASSLSEIFEEAWQRRSNGWWAYALRLTRNPADADDVVLEAAARTLETCPDLDSELRLHAYVTTAIRHIALNVVRGRGREIAYVDGAGPANGGHASSPLQVAVSDEARALRKSLCARARGHLVDLRREHREAVELMVLRVPPLKLREVADLQGVATSTVSYRLRRALEELATAISVADRGLPGSVDGPGQGGRFTP